jgi:hypothetical protein
MAFKLLLPRPSRYISFGLLNEADVTLQYFPDISPKRNNEAPLFTPTTPRRVTKTSA